MLSGKVPKLNIEEHQTDDDGAMRWIVTSKWPFFDPDGNVAGLFGTYRDITDEKLASERLAYEANHDGLTGLANRRKAEADIESILSHETQGRIAVVYIDLDKFKAANDKFGHDVGDQLLKETAWRLQKGFAGADVVARLGGDEFVVVVSDSHQQADNDFRSMVSETIVSSLDLLRMPHRALGFPILLDASVGVYLPEAGDDIETCLRNADLAMYRSKLGNAGEICWFDPAFEKANQRYRSLQRDIQRAITGREFYMQYQPIVHAGKGPIGVEALARWRGREKEVGPDKFISVAESCDLIHELGHHCLRESCSDFVAWKQSGKPGPQFLAVNVSAKELLSEQWLERFTGLVSESGVSPSELHVEITESVLLQDLKTAAEVVSRLSELGYKVVLDDFGSGYSSLKYLAELPIKKVKLDKSFCESIATSREYQVVVGGTVSVCRQMNLPIICEGIEHQSQQQLLMTLGCEEFQGFFFSKPVNADEILNYWSENAK